MDSRKECRGPALTGGKMENRIAVVLTGNERKLKNIVSKAGWIELRIDEFLRSSREDEILKWVKKIRSIASGRIIGTVRWKKEQPEPSFYIPDKKRKEIYEKIMDFVDYVDVELRSKIVPQVIKSAREKGKKVILSYHNFSKTPNFSKLTEIYRKGIRLKPDILKIATKIDSKKSLLTILKFTYHYSKKVPLVITPMGVSVVERLIPLYFGSIFTYVSAGKKTAPSQPSYKQIEKIL